MTSTSTIPSRNPNDIQADLERCMLNDRPRLLRLWQNKRTPRKRLMHEIALSQQRVERRKINLPRVDSGAPLPIHARRTEIQRSIERHQVTVVVGETGSGKSTQIPKYCLAAGRGIVGIIGHTQPRRIAARSIAVRIAEELHSDLGTSVGYQIRFNSQVSRQSYIKVMTDGLLLAELESDRRLENYDTIIVDEAHERSLNIDFLLGYLKQLLPRRPELRLIVTSATIDPRRFSKYFDDAPVIEVGGRSYPVAVRYLEKPGRSRTDEDPRSTAADDNMEMQILGAVNELAADTPGDILVFLPGEREIRNAAAVLHKHKPRHTEVLPLYARLSTAEQQAVFKPHTGRRVVLATNVAETSLTIPGIRYVVDTGLARISRYRPGRQIQALPIEPISRASADQRKGRCGRQADGICLRLYSENDFAARPAFTEPEILRTSLASVILSMKHLGLGDIEDYPFIEAPSARMIDDGYRLLEELDAIDDRHRLTGLGKRLARIPVDPRLGRMLLAAHQRHCVAEMLVICSALSIQDPRSYPRAAAEQARACHARYEHPHSAFLTYLNLWRKVRKDTRSMSRNRTRKYCQQAFLSYARIREWQNVHSLLCDQCRKLDMSQNPEPAAEQTVHQALLPGLLGNIGHRREQNEYQGTRGKKFFIHAGSRKRKQMPKWVVGADLIDTHRLYLHTVAEIRPEWIESAATHLTQKSYLDPHWDARLGRVLAYEQVTLYGLVIIPRRKVNYGPIDPAGAREIFIRGTLLPRSLSPEDEAKTRAGPLQKTRFYANNLQLIDGIDQLEHRSRRKDILVNEDILFDFFNRQVPADTCDTKRFLKWYKIASAKDAGILCLHPDMLMQHSAEHVTEDRFPDSVTFDGNSLPCRYRFEPGHPNDGVTVSVPLALLKHLRPEPFSWLVPGLLLEKIIALIRSLPKAKRKNFVPVPDHAERCLNLLDKAQGSLTDALSAALDALTGTRIDASEWDESRLPAHLRFNLAVLDTDGTALAHGRSIGDLQLDLSTHPAVAAAAPHTDDLPRSGFTAWDFGDLPESTQCRAGGVTLTAYPCLVDNTTSVAIELRDNRAESASLHRQGLRRLVLLQLPEHARQLRKRPPWLDRVCLNFATVGTCEGLHQDLVNAALDEILSGGDDVRTEREFSDKVGRARTALLAVFHDMGMLTDKILALYRQCMTDSEGVNRASASDVRAQLSRLIFPGFAQDAGFDRLKHYPRYLEAVRIRLARARHSPQKESAGMALIEPHWDRVLRHVDDNAANRDLLDYRWLLEEYRVSVFAQELKTAVPVSAKRLQRKWAHIDLKRDA